MINFLRTIVKIFEGIMWLYLPVVMIYWSLSLIKLDAINPLKATVGIIVQPLMLLINKYFYFHFTFGGEEVDYTPVMLAAGVVIVALGLMFTSKVLDFIEEKLTAAKMELLKRKEMRIRQKERQYEIEELERNKVLYVMIRLTKILKHESYLVNSEGDAFSVGLIDSYEASIKNIAKNFSGKEFKDFKSEDPEISSFVFTDTEQFLIYLTYLTEKIKEINKGTQDDLNTVFTYAVACNCSYDTVTAQTDLQLTNKILNLVGQEEIYITDVLKKKLENLDTDISMKFESKGIYILDEKDFDVYRLKIY